jgi:hypothetical protein
MEPHSIVVISLHTPKERLWGELMAISSSGVTLRGIDLSSFDDFVSQVLHPEGDRMGLPTLFFPMLRIERIALDEARGSKRRPAARSRIIWRSLRRGLFPALYKTHS